MIKTTPFEMVFIIRDRMKMVQYKMGDAEVTIVHNGINIAIAEREAGSGGYTITEVEDQPAALTVEERLSALEKSVTAADYAVGTWYHRGDKVTFEGSVYTCIAPEGTVCVWNPAQYPSYWS